MLDEATGLLHDRYLLERGERIEDEPWTPTGFSKYALESRESLLVGENIEEAAERLGSEVVAGSEAPKSVLFVPLIVGGKATGVISLQNADREHAFGDSDQQLLETLAGSLSVALENARLVHETRQRNAELALINDAVGDRIRELFFDAQVVSIRTFDETTGLVHFPYVIERGQRLTGEPMALGAAGFSNHVLTTKESLRIVENMDAESEHHGSLIIAGSEDTRSLLFVPLVTGGKATGIVGLENIDREHAFSESDEQLLETLAGSLSVALENARLVHETRQRNAELALINGVQEAIAGELDSQAIYDAVGDRIQGVFDAQSVFISIVDKATGFMEFPYINERGERMTAEPDPPGGVSKHVLETRESLLLTDVAAQSERFESKLLAGDWPKSSL